jgi:hypothetical protein
MRETLARHPAASRHRLQEAWPTHLVSVRRRIFDHLGDLDLPSLAKALDAIAGDV